MTYALVLKSSKGATAKDIYEKLMEAIRDKGINFKVLGNPNGGSGLTLEGEEGKPEFKKLISNIGGIIITQDINY